MAIGSALIATGLVVPWFIYSFLPPGGTLTIRLPKGSITRPQHVGFVNIFNYKHVDIIPDWITLTPYNPALDRGITAVEIIAIASAFLAVLTALNETRLAARFPTPLKIASVATLKFVHLAAIIPFLALMWWVTIDYHYQTFLREAVFATLHGGHFGARIASYCGALPFPGMFMIAAGVLVSSVGMYTRSSSRTVDEIQARNAKAFKAIRRLVAGFVGLLILSSLIALLLGHASTGST